MVFEHSVSYLWVCVAAEGAKNFSWLWLSLLRGWGSLTMSLTDKFVYVYMYVCMVRYRINLRWLISILGSIFVLIVLLLFCNGFIDYLQIFSYVWPYSSEKLLKNSINFHIILRDIFLEFVWLFEKKFRPFFFVILRQESKNFQGAICWNWLGWRKTFILKNNRGSRKKGFHINVAFKFIYKYYWVKEFPMCDLLELIRLKKNLHIEE